MCEAEIKRIEQICGALVLPEDFANCPIQPLVADVAAWSRIKQLARLGAMVEARGVEQHRVRYQHYKGGTYRMVAIAANEASGELKAVYQSENDYRVWEQPLSRFQEVLGEGMTHYYRFQELGEEKVVLRCDRCRVRSEDVVKVKLPRVPQIKESMWGTSIQACTWCLHELQLM